MAQSDRMRPGIDYLVATRQGSIALDGEREIELLDGDSAEVRLSLEGPWTLDVSATLREAVRSGVLGDVPPDPPMP